MNVPPQGQLPWLPAEPPALPEPTGRKRWSQRRIEATAGNAIVGFVLGIIAIPVWGLLGYLALVLLAHVIAMGRPSSVGELLYATPIAAILGWSALYFGARGTCSKSPVAPLGVTIGLGVGSLAAVSPWIGSIFTGNARFIDLPLIGAFLLVGALQCVAAYRGGMRGLAQRFGTPQVGVGVLCATCGYDLERTPPQWPCPECGGMLRYPTKSPDPDGVDPEPEAKRPQ